MAFGRLLNQTIQVFNPDGSRNRQGQPDYSNGVTVKARVERSNRTTVTAQHDREPVDLVVFVLPTADVEIGAKLVYAGVDYRVLNRSDVVGRGGAVHHREIMAQIWSGSNG